LQTIFKTRFGGFFVAIHNGWDRGSDIFAFLRRHAVSFQDQWFSALTL
jgi:hypothetical protein